MKDELIKMYTELLHFHKESTIHILKEYCFNDYDVKRNELDRDILERRKAFIKCLEGDERIKLILMEGIMMENIRMMIREVSFVLDNTEKLRDEYSIDKREFIDGRIYEMKKTLMNLEWLIKCDNLANGLDEEE